VPFGSRIGAGAIVTMSATERRFSIAAVLVLAAQVALLAFFARARVGPLPILICSGILVVFAVAVTRRNNAWPLMGEVGLDAPIVGFALGLVMGAPAVVAMVVSGHHVTETNPRHAVALALSTAFAYEIVDRGYAFRTLHRRAGLRFLTAALVSSVGFAAARVLGSSGPVTALEPWLFALVQGVWLAWLFARWNDSLWVGLGVHFADNLVALLFPADPMTYAGRAAAVAASVAITLKWGPARRPPPGAAPPAETKLVR
jgi:membrane protease YdiL (CAAX protease family)